MDARAAQLKLSTHGGTRRELAKRLKSGGAMPKTSKSGSSITATHHTVRTDGATVFYRIRGSGALLLILPGGDGAPTPPMRYATN
jgi:hypothetical protein